MWGLGGSVLPSGASAVAGTPPVAAASTDTCVGAGVEGATL